MSRIFLWTRRKRNWAIWCRIARCARSPVFWALQGLCYGIAAVPR